MVSDKDKNKGGAGDETNSDIPAEEMIGAPSFSSEVDWDAEWKKVMDDQRLCKKAERPGAGFYKTEAEIKAIQAANKAAQQARQVQASLPSWQMLKGDWKVGLRIRGIACPGNEWHEMLLVKTVSSCLLLDLCFVSISRCIFRLHFTVLDWNFGHY